MLGKCGHSVAARRPEPATLCERLQAFDKPRGGEDRGFESRFPLHQNREELRKLLSSKGRGTQGRKRSLAVHAARIPLGIVATLANRQDAPAWVALRETDTTMTVDLDRAP